MRTDYDLEEDMRMPQASRIGTAGMGALRIALLFGSAAVALALIVAPVAEKQFVRQAGVGGLDHMSTGSIGRSDIYTVRRSVLQASPSSICIIQGNGRRSGDCR